MHLCFYSAVFVDEGKNVSAIDEAVSALLFDRSNQLKYTF